MYKDILKLFSACNITHDLLEFNKKLLSTSSLNKKRAPLKKKLNLKQLVTFKLIKLIEFG